MYPRSISMPSSTSTVVSSDEDDSMDSTPSGPTFSIASAIMRPISSSFPAEMEATALMSSVPLTGWDSASSFSTNAAHALSMPRLSATGLRPAVTLCRPYLISSRASTEAVVVPSPATSFVLPATSLMSCAPAFSTGSLSSIARAMLTPSLITRGMPYPSFSRTTFRPRGPSVTPTASANLSIPFSILARASLPSVIFFASARTETVLGLADRDEFL
mmetsp:Transcript_25650/g.48618  ORF Transcript_25650/g.48618 Transcript_25650/m.48618 type:complete len:217 (-) Transcript_25650:132-782(-)